MRKAIVRNLEITGQGLKPGTDGLYDDPYYWVGRVRSMTWAVRQGRFDRLEAPLAEALHSDGELVVDVQVGSADYMVVVYSASAVVWGVPCLQYSWEAALVTRELEHFLAEARRTSVRAARLH